MSQADAGSPQSQDWIVGNPSLLQVASALWIGSAGLLVLGLQPVLLGALLDEHRINLDQLALTATLEIIAIGIGSAVAAMMFSTRNLRLKAAILLVVLAALDYGMSLANSPNAILIVRVVAGIVEGFMVAVSIELIARSRNAERLGGYFVALQTSAQCAAAFALGKWVLHSALAGATGANAGFLFVAIVCVVSLLAAMAMPAEYGAIPKVAGNADGLLTLRAILSLLGIVALFMCIGAIWAFLEPLGAEHGVDSHTVDFMVSASLGAQVLGALAATWLQGRINYRAAIVACGVVALACAAVIGSKATSPPLFWTAVLAIGFVWMFVIPFQIGQTIAADSSRSTALLVPAANLFGAALGPLAASVFVSGDNASAVPFFSMGAVVVSLALFGWFLMSSRRSALA